MVDQFNARRRTEFPCQNFLLSINLKLSRGLQAFRPEALKHSFVRFKSLINYFYESIFDCCFYFCTIFNDFLRSSAKDCNYLHSISSFALPDRLLLSYLPRFLPQLFICATQFFFLQNSKGIL